MQSLTQRQTKHIAPFNKYSGRVEEARSATVCLFIYLFIRFADSDKELSDIVELFSRTLIKLLTFAIESANSNFISNFCLPCLKEKPLKIRGRIETKV